MRASIREISPCNTTTPVTPNNIKLGDFETFNPCDIADAFNQFFSRIADTRVPHDNHMPQVSEFQTLSEHVRTKLV